MPLFGELGRICAASSVPVPFTLPRGSSDLLRQSVVAAIAFLPCDNQRFGCDGSRVCNSNRPGP